MNTGMVVAGGMEIASGALLGFATIPGVPDDLQSWPVAAIGGLLGIMGMYVAYRTMQTAMKGLTDVSITMSANTIALGVHTEAQKATNDQIAQLCNTVVKTHEEFNKFVITDAMRREYRESGKVTINTGQG